MSTSATPPTGGPQRLLISLATFNEAGNLRPLVQEIRQFAPHAAILVVDDNSPDGTGAIAEELKAALPDIHILHRPAKLGLGTAMLDAMRFAIAHEFDALLTLDADGSHPPENIPAMLAGMERPRRDDRVTLRPRGRCGRSST